MAEMKNICGKIPMELHTRVRQEIEQREISTQQFIQQVIEEHFTEKGGQISMAVRTVAVQVSEELFARFKAAVAKKGCRQKDFLIALIEKAIEEIEAEFGEEKEPAEPVEETETEEAESEEPAEPEAEETEAEAPEAEGPEDDPEWESEETAGTEGSDEENAREAEGPEVSENEGASEPETADTDEAGLEPDDTATEE